MAAIPWSMPPFAGGPMVNRDQNGIAPFGWRVSSIRFEFKDQRQRVRDVFTATPVQFVSPCLFAIQFQVTPAMRSLKVIVKVDRESDRGEIEEVAFSTSLNPSSPTPPLYYRFRLTYHGFKLHTHLEAIN